jgi:hypothetical protein
MISGRTFRKWGQWPYFQITDPNSEYLRKISRKITSLLALKYEYELNFQEKSTFCKFISKKKDYFPQA